MLSNEYCSLCYNFFRLQFFFQQIGVSANSNGEQDTFRELDVSMRAANCKNVVLFYGALFREVCIMSSYHCAVFVTCYTCFEKLDSNIIGAISTVVAIFNESCIMSKMIVHCTHNIIECMNLCHVYFDAFRFILGIFCICCFYCISGKFKLTDINWSL